MLGISLWFHDYKYNHLHQKDTDKSLFVQNKKTLLGCTLLTEMLIDNFSLPFCIPMYDLHFLFSFVVLN